MNNNVNLEQFLNTLVWNEGLTISIAKGMHSNEYYYEGKLQDLPYMLVKEYEFFTVLRVHWYNNNLKIRIENAENLSRYQTGIITNKT